MYRAYLAGAIVGSRDELVARLVEGAVGQRQDVRTENLQADGEVDKAHKRQETVTTKCCYNSRYATSVPAYVMSVRRAQVA